MEYGCPKCKQNQFKAVTNIQKTSVINNFGEEIQPVVEEVVSEELTCCGCGFRGDKEEFRLINCLDYIDSSCLHVCSEIIKEEKNTLIIQPFAATPSDSCMHIPSDFFKNQKEFKIIARLFDKIENKFALHVLSVEDNKVFFLNDIKRTRYTSKDIGAIRAAEIEIADRYESTGDTTENTE